MGTLSGKKALITGALGTIGMAMVAGFAKEGAEVIALDRPGTKGAEEKVRSVAPGTRYFGCDLNDVRATEKCASELAVELGGIDILVNNAALVIMKPFEQFSYEEYEDQVRINSTASFALVRACCPQMKAKKQGKIVNITSLTLTGRWDGYVPYIASKGAQFGLTKGLARELGQYCINVNAISPGAVVSEAEFRDRGDRREEYHQWILENQSLKRRIEASDVANLAIFLSSPASDLISGQNINIDAGW
jgi:NAD(P)-dependent dehydrogenase (short-subunit alcohol dehydrogenase family)